MYQRSFDNAFRSLSLLKESRRTSKFMQYALYAADEALRDARWHPKTDSDQENTVWLPHLSRTEKLSAHFLRRESVLAQVSAV